VQVNGGTSLAFACKLFGIELDVYMVKVSFEQKPYRKLVMQTYGARCVASPSNETDSGKAILEKFPDSSGSLGIAISEAVEMAAKNPDTKYALGSVLNHVLMHQTIVGNEALLQMEMADDYPDILVGCTGGGSNFAGLVFPFIGKNFREGTNTRVIACEPKSCPSLTKGKFVYDFGDTGRLTPLMKTHTLGSQFVPPATHSGGLRYHAMAPMVSHLKEINAIEAKSYGQKECFEAGVNFARTEGIVPAPEATHAVKGAIDAALECKKNGESKSILFNLCGHGHFDMKAYGDFFDGNLAEDKFDQASVDKALEELPKIA
jgi:tryptophan synthase beta chain